MRDVLLDPLKQLNEGFLDFPLASLERVRGFILKTTDAVKGQGEFRLFQAERREVELSLLADMGAEKLYETLSNQGEQGDVHGEPRVPRYLLDHLPKGFGHAKPVSVEEYLAFFPLSIIHSTNCNASTIKRQGIDTLCQWCHIEHIAQVAQHESEAA